MHELSLIADLIAKIETIANEQKSEKVVGVTVKLGALSHISADHFREHFINETVRTIAENSELIINVSTDISDPHAQEILLESVELAV